MADVATMLSIDCLLEIIRQRKEVQSLVGVWYYTLNSANKYFVDGAYFTIYEESGKLWYQGASMTLYAL